MKIIVAERCQVSGLVLAGGRGRRMGHVDKGLLDFKGNQLAFHAAQRLRPQVDQIMINANQNLDRYRAFGMPVCADMMSGFQGPLAGLQVPALRHNCIQYLAYLAAQYCRSFRIT
jgi:molybdopterin-guanine dinucleotide biosynthesis protein A